MLLKKLTTQDLDLHLIVKHYVDLDSETLTIAGGTGIDTSSSSNTLTFAIDLILQH